MHSSAHIRVLPIEIRLLWSEESQVVFLRFLVPSPSTVGLAQDHGPIVWGLTPAILVVFGWLPMVPAAFGVILGRTRLEEPVVLIGCVIDNEIHHQFHVTLVETGDQLVNIF
jgi:hypothetical protein